MTLTLPTKSIAGPSCRNSRHADRHHCPGIYLSAISASHVRFILIKGLSANKTFALASGLWPALAAPQSQNPRRSPATPAVLLNLRDQISLKIRRNL
jgi:hypothetical protein